jgi:hypothetical protein
MDKRHRHFKTVSMGQRTHRKQRKSLLFYLRLLCKLLKLNSTCSICCTTSCTANPQQIHNFRRVLQLVAQQIHNKSNKWRLNLSQLRVRNAHKPLHSARTLFYMSTLDWTSASFHRLANGDWCDGCRWENLRKRRDQLSSSFTHELSNDETAARLKIECQQSGLQLVYSDWIIRIL